MHMMSVVGMLVFTQFWYWFPLSHFLSLAFTPTTVIALTSELKMPKVTDHKSFFFFNLKALC
jgi:26S proteasome regulatory subunit N2